VPYLPVPENQALTGNLALARLQCVINLDNGIDRLRVVGQKATRLPTAVPESRVAWRPPARTLMNASAANPGQRPRRLRLPSRARRRYEERGGKPLHVSIGFVSRADMRHVSRSDAADEIASFLLDLDPPIGKLVNWQRRAVNREAPPEQLVFMNVLAVPDPAMAHWGAPRAGWVAPLSADFLQPYVDEKSRKFAQYRRVSEEVWLLLAIEGKAPSQLFEPSGEIPVVTSPFDRTYLLSIFPGTVQLLTRATDA